MSRPFRDDEEVVLAESAGATFFNALLLLLVAGVALYIALPRLFRGEGDMLILAASATVLVWLAFALNRRRLALRGEHFESRGLVREDVAVAHDFLGWDRDAWGRLRLLRRSDLRWVPLTASLKGTWPAADVRRWLKTYLPGISPRGVPEIRQSVEASKSLLLHRLGGPLEASGEDFPGSQRDIELASAARMVARRRVIEARVELEHMLRELPADSVALPFVFDALGSVGTGETATLLESMRTRFRGDAAAHCARAYCRISTVNQLETLRTLSTDPDWFVQRQAERALARLQPDAAITASQ